jgi:membrane-associated phospholipid phosphatase
MSIDRHLDRWVVHHRVGWLNPVFVALTRIGSGGVVWVVIAIVLAVLWRRPGIVVRVLAADLGAGILTYGLKLAVGRDRPPSLHPRPKPLIGTPHDASFPSGHAASAFACAATLGWALPRYRIPLLVLAAGVAWSRVYVGVHYPADVMAGAILGLLVAAAVAVLAGRRRRRGGRRRERSGGAAPAG